MTWIAVSNSLGTARGWQRPEEAKVLASWRRDRDVPRYDAAIETATVAVASGELAFEERLLRNAQRTGFGAAPQPAILSDGSAWIANLSEKHFPDATPILDFYHASSRIYDACEAHCGTDTARAKAKHQELKGKLRHGQTSAVINALRQFGASEEAAYLANNQFRLDYPRYRNEGLPISLSRIESAFKNVIGTRFKRGGMRWSSAGAKKMLALRCRCLSEELDQWYELQQERCRAHVAALTSDDYACA